MLKGFKDFLLRGNVIDLSVAVIMGAAFSAIVTSLTDKILRPLLNAITPPASPGLSVELVAGKPSTLIDFAAAITAVVNFAMIAAVVYFVIVMPMRRIQQRRKRGEESGPAEPTDVQLLAEIRDLLRGETGSTTASTTASTMSDAADGHSTSAGAEGQHGSSADRAGEEEPALFTQPHKSVPPPAGAGGSGRQAVGPVGGTTQAIRPVGGAEQPVGEPGSSEGGRHSATPDQAQRPRRFR